MQHKSPNEIIALAKERCSLNGRKDIAQLALNAEKLGKRSGISETTRVLWSEKLDGVYSLLISTNQGCRFFSRTGEHYSSMDLIADELLLLNCGVYIVELYNPDMIQQDISGEARRFEASVNLSAYVHDYLTIEEFVNGSSTLPYNQRIAKVPLMVEFEGHERFIMVEQREMSFAEAVALAHADIKAGAEGGIIRPLDAAWQAGNRSRNLIRVKEKIEIDLRCVGWLEGKGKRATKAGGVGKLLFALGDKVIPVGGGKWFTNANMIGFHAEPELVVGRICQVSAMRRTRDAMLREPRVDCVRYDKTEADE